LHETFTTRRVSWILREVFELHVFFSVPAQRSLVLPTGRVASDIGPNRSNVLTVRCQNHAHHKQHEPLPAILMSNRCAFFKAIPTAQLGSRTAADRSSVASYFPYRFGMVHKNNLWLKPYPAESPKEKASPHSLREYRRRTGGSPRSEPDSPRQPSWRSHSPRRCAPG
jgi:hypothetical protein